MKNLKQIKKQTKLIIEFIKYRIFRPIRKYVKRKIYERKRKIVNQAIGELFGDMEPTLLKILEDTLKQYNRQVLDGNYQNHWLIQAQIDIKTIYKNVLKEFILCSK